MALPKTGGGGGASSPHQQLMDTPKLYKSSAADLDKSSSYSVKDTTTTTTTTTTITTQNKANARESFSSIREDDQDLAQAFTTSKVSAYAHHTEEAVDDDDDDSYLYSDLQSLGTMVSQAEFFPPVTQPHSRLHGRWNAIDSCKGWKAINVKGRLASRSFSDLLSLSQAWLPHSTGAFQMRRPSQNLSGDSPLESLPLEIQSLIFSHLVIDIPPNSLTKRNIDLMSLLLTSKTLNAATLVTLYRQITIPHSRIYRKFLTQIASHPELGKMVRRMDFCHFNPNMMFSTASERSLAQNLTASTVLEALDLMPNLQEFLAQEHIDTDLDEHVLRKLFFGLDRVAALDFCGCDSTAFRTAFMSAIPAGAAWGSMGGDLDLKRLSLHKCTTLPSSVFESLLPHLPHLTHLDVAGTRMTDAALAAIPHSARITHLNLAKCTNLSADAIIQFLSTHPAVASRDPSVPSTIVWLSLSADASTHETFDEDAVTRLLPLLPKSLKSLSLKGSKMNTSHIPLLLPLTKHLEELALGRGLSITDTNALFIPDTTTKPRPPCPEQQQQQQQHQQHQHQEEACDSCMDIDTDAITSNNPAATWQPHTLRYLDLSDLWSTEFSLPTLYDTAQCALLTRATEPLEVLEVHADVGQRARPAPLARLGWHSSEAGRRVWIVRDCCGGTNATPAAAAARTSRPAWKMGADNWGARKIAVARADVGGMYGSYMFARRL
ncbi:unnamed protein product [Discula destructiva]